MDEEIKAESIWEPYVWRGILGGVIGNLFVGLLAAVYLAFRLGAESLRDFLVIWGVMGLVGGAIVGLAIGYVIYKVTGKMGKQPNGALRIVIGAVCFLGQGLLMGLTKRDASYLAFTIAYTALVGGFAGFMARAKGDRASSTLSARRA